MSATATAFAPASIGNVGVGFDLLGHAISGAGDRVSVQRVGTPGVRVRAITGCVTELPLEPERNTAARALQAMIAALELDHGFDIHIEKGIALGSGMGGSAASAVAAVVAANALLPEPLPRAALYPFALAGEAVASGSAHGDNIGPALLGGLVLASPTQLLSLAVPAAWHVALVHPELILETRRSREVLAGAFHLSEFVAQSTHLALFLTGCQRGDAELVRAGLRDVLIEPRRAALIPGFAAVKAAALAAGALGASISGGGPSVFAWFTERAAAEQASLAMQRAFAAAGIGANAFVSAIASPGAEVMQCSL
ncbi:MAG: homoserine kinase [Lysobacterales bacterium CG17_big_fil_post_rev_8_21_14_2_50_64_11]|nr:MAG: homoserine kinase [Xanthomonadales bacterium CG17_big_fil_post_rev_8_21_14_2_50_64_11]